MKGKHTNKQHKNKRELDTKGGMSPVKWLLLAVLILLMLSAGFYYLSGGFGNFAGFKGSNDDESVQAGPLAPFFRSGSADQTTGTNGTTNTGTTGTTRTSTSNSTTGTTSTTNNTSKEVIQSGEGTTNNRGLINSNDNNIPVLDNAQDIIPDVNTGVVDNATKTLNDTIDQTPVGDTINQTPVGGVIEQVQNSVSNTIESLGL